MQGEIGDLEIRPCTPPNREMAPVNFRYRRGGVSALAEHDEADEAEKAQIAQQDENEDIKEVPTVQSKLNKEDPPIIMVFWDDGRRRHEVELSHYQEYVLCKLWDKHFAETGTVPEEKHYRGDTLDGTVHCSYRAYVSIRYGDDRIGEIWLSTSQKDAIWNARNIDPETLPPVGRNYVQFKSKSSTSCGLPMNLLALPLLAKLKRKTGEENRPVNYTTVWNNNEFAAYDNGQHTRISDDLGSALPVSISRFSRNSDAILKPARGIRASVKRIFSKLKGAQQPHGPQRHNAKCVFGDPKSAKIEGLEEIYRQNNPIRYRIKQLFGHKPLLRIKQLLRRMDPFQPASPPPPEPATPEFFWDRRNLNQMEADNAYAQVQNWLHNQDMSGHPDNRLVALTNDELMRLKGQSADQFQVVRPDYLVPPPSLASSESGDEDEEGNENGQDGANKAGPKAGQGGKKRDHDDDPGAGQAGGSGAGHGNRRGYGQGDRHVAGYESGYESGRDGGQQAGNQTGHDAGDESVHEAGEEHNQESDQYDGKIKIQEFTNDGTQVEALESGYDEIWDKVKGADHYEIREQVENESESEAEGRTLASNGDEAHAVEEENLVTLRRDIIATHCPLASFAINSLRDSNSKDTMAAEGQKVGSGLIAESRGQCGDSSIQGGDSSIQGGESYIHVGESSVQTEASPAHAEGQATPLATPLASPRSDISPFNPGGKGFAARQENRDLRRVPKFYSGFYISSPFMFQSMLDVNDNKSDGYRMPLIDPRAGSKVIARGFNLERKRKDSILSEAYTSLDLPPQEEFSDDEDENKLYPPRSQAPGQAVLLHLLFQGAHIDALTEELGLLDEYFLHKMENRWFKHIRIPELWQLHEVNVGEILYVAKSDKKWWEGELDPDGNEISDCIPLVQARLRVRNAKILARQTVENYFWWRLMGQRVHPEIPGGHIVYEYDN